MSSRHHEVVQFANDFFTTKDTKRTEVSDLELLNFVSFVSPW